jgi:arylsulfatase A-like enzyme
LKSLGILENTIVVFTTDHGNHFKTRNAEYKRSCHESSVRIPCAISGPGFEAGGQIQQLSNLLDLPPTLLDAAGIAVPEIMQGHSLMPLVRHQKVDWDDEVFIQISESHVGRAIRTKRWKYSVAAGSLGGSELADAASYTEEYLYDLESDPFEMNNLAGLVSHRRLADLLRERLIERMLRAGEAAPQILPAPERGANPQRFLFPDEISL